MNRSKGTHLTYNERLWIYKSSRYEGGSLSKICQRYGVSISTARRIIKQFSSNIRRSEIYSKIRCKKAIFSTTAMDWISEYVKSISWRFTSLRVHRHILKNLSIPIPRHQIYKHLKHNELLSYKKGSARPYILDIKKLKLTNQLFWVKLAQSLPSIKILIDLGEGTVSKDTKANYSWLKTSKHWSINNIVFGGSINLISCITIDGLAINLLKHWSSNAKILIKFLKYLFEYLKEQGIFPYQTGIILYNWAFHRAIWVKDYWRSIGVNLCYLPANWTELASIELYFSRLKESLVKSFAKLQLDLKSESVLSIISNSVHSLSKEYIHKLLKNFFSLVRSGLEQTLIHFTEKYN